MAEVLDQAVARTDKAMLDIALRSLGDMRLTTNPLIKDLNMDIAAMVLRELYERVQARVQ